MNAQLNLTFNSYSELEQFIRRMSARDDAPPTMVKLVEPYPIARFSIADAEPAAAPDVQPDVQPEQPTAPLRKRRADAGQPRGPHKTNGADAGTTASSASGEPTAGAKAGDPVASEGSPATQTAAAPAPTPAEARAALKRISDCKALGAEQCISHLQEFGVNQLSKLPESMFAAFIAAADAKVAAAK